MRHYHVVSSARESLSLLRPARNQLRIQTNTEEQKLAQIMLKS